MGTNYYAHTSASDAEGLHIGKKSAGWDFLVHAIPEQGLTTAAAWRKSLAKAGTYVTDEYGQRIPVGEFFEMATARPVDTTPKLRAHGDMHTYRRDPLFHVDMDARGVPFLNAEFF